MIGFRTNPVSARFALGIVFSALIPVPGLAQINQGPVAAASTDLPADANTIIYRTEDFARFAPRTALDLVDKIPDFSLSETRNDRGLGQASQNILINGQRVAGKDNDARTALSQIAAAAVERIEVSDGARLGIPGLTGRVANIVVRSRDVRVQWRWEGQNRRNIPDQWTSGAISASGRLGSTDFTISLSNSDATRRGGVGLETAWAGSGELRTLRRRRDIFRVDSPRLAGSVHRETAAGSVLNLRLSGERYLFRTDFDAIALPIAGSASSDEQFRQSARDWTIEAGGDYEFAFGPGRLKLIVLQSIGSSRSTSTFVSHPQVPGAMTQGSLFERMSDESETVLRTEYGWGRPGSEWQLAAEAAYNFVDVTSTVGTLLPDSSYSRRPLPGGDTFIDEWRANLSAARNWALAEGLSLQTSAGGEYSQIRQTSAGGLSRSFLRPKGSLALAWALDRTVTINAGIERRVGQLSFLDFSAAVDLNSGVSNAANVRLVPEQSWRVDAEVIRSFGAVGSITFGGYGEWISDIVDRIPINATEEGIGNLPHARRWGMTARGTILLDGIGWHGGRLNANGDFRFSRVRDPLTGQFRRISDDLIRRWSIDLRHDVPQSDMAWGGSLSEEIKGPTFRLDQLYSARLSQPIATLFVEHKDVMGMTVRFTLRNVLNGHDEARRTYYIDRRDGPVDEFERQTRNIYLIGVVTVNGTF